MDVMGATPTTSTTRTRRLITMTTFLDKLVNWDFVAANTGPPALIRQRFRCCSFQASSQPLFLNDLRLRRGFFLIRCGSAFRWLLQPGLADGRQTAAGAITYAIAIWKRTVARVIASHRGSASLATEAKRSPAAAVNCA